MGVLPAHLFLRVNMPFLVSRTSKINLIINLRNFWTLKSSWHFKNIQLFWKQQPEYRITTLILREECPNTNQKNLRIWTFFYAMLVMLFQIFYIIICVFFCFRTRFKFNSSRIFHFIHCYNPFLAKVPILYPLKRPKNKKFSSVFKEHKIAILAWNGLRNRPRIR